ncbi:MAG: hypothetical protein EBY76_11705, partial [Betaproteobacteria bacterium]|nr:hypothetical protein [Betaproteobacteria bacterium]
MKSSVRPALTTAPVVRGLDMDHDLRRGQRCTVLNRPVSLINRGKPVQINRATSDAAITFNERNPEALRLAQSIKNLDVGDLHAAISLIAKGTRWFASINTQYNPIFGIINFARDLQSGLLNLSTTAIAGQEKEVAANVWPALKAIYRTERGNDGS